MKRYRVWNNHTEYVALLSEVVLAATVKLIDTLHEAEKSLIAAKGGASQ